MFDRWRRDGTRHPVPITDRVGYTVHHTAGGVGTNPLTYARSVANMHFSNWSRPGGYNFQIGTDGRIFEMCGWGFVGAHAPNCNRNRVGVSFQGSFVSRLPNAQQLEAFSWLVRTHRVPNNQRGHRDCSSTTCPGAALYAALPLRVAAPTPPPPPAPPQSPDLEGETMFTRIDGSTVVYAIRKEVTGTLLIPVTRPEMDAFAEVLGWRHWQDHVGNLTSRQVRDAGFTVLR